ncbi:MAG: flavocytochrome c [Raoultibacter sp.]
MIQNPNEIAARQRAEKTMARIYANTARHFQMNRRQFLRGAAATAALAAFGLAGCSPKNTGTAAPQSYKADTYTASSEGRNGTIKVKVTFDEAAITAIESEHEESRNIGDTAISLLTEKYLASQSLNFDVVTGASLSSMAFATAVADCVSQAGGDVKALKKKESGVEPAPAIDETCDVCIVGTGGAAFAAAVTAAEAGKSVIMLEKMDIYGGNTNAGEGTLNAPDPARQQPLGIEDSADLYFQQTFEGGDSAGDPALVRILADNALDAVHWMEDHGLVYEKEVFTAIGGLWQRGHAVEVEKKGYQGGSYYVSSLKECADKTGKVTLYTDAKADSIIKSGDVVTGITGTRPSSGAAVNVVAQSVILATGGYARNAELAMQYDKRVTKAMPSSNVSSSTGDGLGLGERAGAGLRNMELVQVHPLGDPQNGGVATFVGNWLGVEDYLMVNDEGMRFVREDERRDTIADAILEQTNDEMWLLVDSTDIAADRKDQIAELVEKGHSFQAQSIADLAGQISVPAQALGQTIDGYNACVKAGVDTQITPGKALLGTGFSDPSYFASKRIPTIHYTMGGLCINASAQVCTATGTPIPGLYAAGEVTGGVQGDNRLGGNSFTDLIVFGRIAGASAAANA